MGVLSDKQEECDGDQVGKGRTSVFLCIKKGLMLEVDMQRGKERCRLELDSLARVETTEASWTCAVRERTGGERPYKGKDSLVETN